MNAQAQVTADQAQTSQPDENETGTNFLERAAGLKKGDAAGAIALVADAVIGGLSGAFDDRFAAAIAASTGLKRKFYSDMLRQMRTVPSGSANRSDKSQPAVGNRNPDPKPNPKPLAQVLDTIFLVIMRQVVCRPDDAHAVTLFICATFGLAGASIFPRLAITSATKRCGKSTLLAVIGALASNPVKADNVSPAAVFRLLPLNLFTLIIDEVDAFFRGSDELRGVVNASHERTGCVLRAVPTPDGKGFTVAEFKVFCAMVLAGIGGLPDTVLDRSIIIKLERAISRGAGGRQPPMRHRDLATVRDRVTPHLVAHAPAIEAAMAAGVKNLPAWLSDREQDCWEPLFAVADLAGGLWPQRVLNAAQRLCGGGDDATSQREMLLADLEPLINSERAAAVKAWQEWVRAGRKGWSAWVQGGRRGACPAPALVQHIRSTDILRHLLEMEHRPWPEFGKDGKGLTPHRLAEMLKPFGMKPAQQRMAVRQPHSLNMTGTENVRTYSIRALRRVFRQYLP